MTKRRDRYREETRDDIKAAARKLMAEHGTGGLSIRAIARELGLTAPAIYYYFASLDDLTTALILDAFNALADSLETARDTNTDKPFAEQMMAVVMAYRDYARQNMTDFQLIYGTPIPGYEAPQEITVPASARTLLIIGQMVGEAVRDGLFTPISPYDTVPEPFKSYFEVTMGGYEMDLPMEAAYITMSAWPRIHGVIMLEIFGHIGPVVGDMDQFYRLQMTYMFREFGIIA